MSDRLKERGVKGRLRPLGPITLCLVLLLPIAAASDLTAQTTDKYRALVSLLRQEWQEADSAFREIRERLSSTPIDTVRVGTLTVMTQRAFGEIVELGAQVAWDSIRQLGPDTLLLTGKTLFVPGYGHTNRYDRERHGAAISSPPLPRRADEEDAVTQILSSLTTLLMDGSDDELRSWVGGHIELQDAGSTSLGWVYVELITSPSKAVRACLLGDIGACRSALALGDLERAELDWYNAAERRVVVERRLPGKTENRRRLWLQCVEHGADDACVEFLADDSEYAVPPPLSLLARRSLLAIAISSGGVGAFTRLVAAAESGREASIAAAANQSTDSLLATWRTTVLSAGQESHATTRRRAATTFLWIIVFAAAATRSSRWRLG